MKYPRKIASSTFVMAPLWVLTVLFLAATAVQAQEARWKELSKEAESLIWAGKGDAAG